MKEKENKKTTWEKMKESFVSSLMSTGIVLVVLLILWISFKGIPSLYSNGSNFVATTLSSLFIPEDVTLTPKINAEITNDKINNNVATNTISTSINTKTPKINTSTQTQVLTQVQKYFGKSDLQVTLIGTGIIDSASKQFIQTNYAGYNDKIAIKFEVKNIGTNISGVWKLRINTPSKTTPYYDSEYQISIKPKDRIIFTTSFDSPISTGINTAYITADPLNMVDEISENNNQLIVPIKIEGSSYSYNNNYNYGNNTIISNIPNGTLYTWTNLNINCYANPQTTYINSPVTWFVTTSGGNGYYSFSWTGSDLLNSNESSITKTYYSSGTKTASVTVTSNGVSITKQCSIYIY